jgi:hypothetical protein
MEIADSTFIIIFQEAMNALYSMECKFLSIDIVVPSHSSNEYYNLLSRMPRLRKLRSTIACLYPHPTPSRKEFTHRNFKIIYKKLLLFICITKHIIYNKQARVVCIQKKKKKFQSFFLMTNCLISSVISIWTIYLLLIIR